MRGCLYRRRKGYAAHWRPTSAEYIGDAGTTTAGYYCQRWVCTEQAITIRQKSLSRGTAISLSESCRKKRISSAKKSIRLSDRRIERPVYRIVQAGTGNPVVTTRQLQNYGFMHSERRQLDSQPENTGTNQLLPQVVPHMVVHSGCCLVLVTNNHRNFPEEHWNVIRKSWNGQWRSTRNRCTKKRYVSYQYQPWTADCWRWFMRRSADFEVFLFRRHPISAVKKPFTGRHNGWRIWLIWCLDVRKMEVWESKL